MSSSLGGPAIPFSRRDAKFENPHLPHENRAIPADSARPMPIRMTFYDGCIHYMHGTKINFAKLEPQAQATKKAQKDLKSAKHWP